MCPPPSHPCLQINLFFPSLHPTPLLVGAPAVEYIKTAVTATVDTPMGPVHKTLHATLIEGLTALCKAKPAAGDAVRAFPHSPLRHLPWGCWRAIS